MTTCIMSMSQEVLIHLIWMDAEFDVLSSPLRTTQVFDYILVLKELNLSFIPPTAILSGQASNPFQCDYTLGVEPCALEFLTHFVGDIHQPLHVSYADDRGGNSVEVHFFNEKTNLHECWDTKIIEKWTSSVDE